MPTCPDLLEKLEQFEFDAKHTDFTFAKRLARDNGWSERYARQAIEEYKRFIYLAALSSESLTPSDVVDQVWHLHLCYTHSYWDKLCRDTLGRALHHAPTRGGEQDALRFVDQYEKTLAVYRQEFAQAPPSAIWPACAQRFNPQEHFVRVDRSSRWLIKKPSRNSWRILLIGAFAFGLSACSEYLADKDIGFWLKILLAIFVLYKLFSWLGSSGGGTGGGASGCGGCGGCGGGD